MRGAITAVALLLTTTSAAALGMKASPPSVVSQPNRREQEDVAGFGGVSLYDEANNMVRYSEPFFVRPSNEKKTKGSAYTPREGEPVASPYLTGRATLAPGYRTGAVDFDFSGSSVAGVMVPPSDQVVYSLGVAIKYPCLTAENKKRGNIIAVYVDEKLSAHIDTGSYWNQRKCEMNVLFDLGCSLVGNHTVRAVKITEPNTGDIDDLNNKITFISFNARSKAILAFKPLPPKELRLEFVGDSITCGMAVNCKNNMDPAVAPYTLTSVVDGYSGQTCSNLDAQCTYVSWSGRGMAYNLREGSHALVSDLYNYAHATDLSESNKWDFSLYTPHLVVINLGTNDFNNPEVRNETTAATAVEKYISKYASFMWQVASTYGPQKVAILAICGNMHYRYCDAVQSAIARVTSAHPEMRKPFFLSIEKKLSPNSMCSNHPDAAVSTIVAQQVTAFIRENVLPTLQ